MNSAPGAPTPARPVLDQDISVNNVQLTVTNSSDSENDPLAYDFEVYSDAGLSVLVFSESGISEQSDSTVSSVISGLIVDTRHFWRARATDGFENTSYRSFSHRGDSL